MAGDSFVYGLTDPRDGAVRYVGATSIGHRRTKQHAYPKDSKRSPKDEWCRELRADGLRPGVTVLEYGLAVDLPVLERYWIAQLRGMDVPLLNVAKGGPGAPGMRHSMEVRERSRRAQLGAPKPKEQRDRMVATKGRPVLVDGRAWYDSIHSAARATGAHPQNIWKVVNGRRPAANGHVFAYAERE